MNKVDTRGAPGHGQRSRWSRVGCTLPRPCCGTALPRSDQSHPALHALSKLAPPVFAPSAAAVIDAATAGDAKGAAPAPNDAAAAAAGTTLLAGPMLQETYLSSATWGSVKSTVDLHSSPAPGAVQFKFSSVYARSIPYQLYACSKRVQRSHYRNVRL